MAIRVRVINGLLKISLGDDKVMLYREEERAGRVCISMVISDRKDRQPIPSDTWA